MMTDKTNIAATARMTKAKKQRQTAATLSEAIQTNDKKRIGELLADLGLQDVHVRVIAAAIDEIPLLQDRIRRGRDAVPTRDRLERQRAVARQIQPVSVEEAGLLAEELNELEDSYSAACRLAASTARAEAELDGIRVRFPLLFDCDDPVKYDLAPLPNSLANLCRTLNLDPKNPLSEPVDWMTAARRREYTPVVMRDHRRFSF